MQQKDERLIFFNEYTAVVNSFTIPPKIIEVGSFTADVAKYAMQHYRADYTIYEASKINFNKLVDVVPPGVRCMNQAISDRNGEINFYDFRSPSSASTHKRKGEVVSAYRVPCVTLAKAMLDCGLAELDILIMNCEGSEKEIIPQIRNQAVKQTFVSYHPQVYGEKEMMSLRAMLKKFYANEIQVVERFYSFVYF